MIARPEQELRADVNGPFFIWAHVDRRVPVKAQFLFVIVGIRGDASSFQRMSVHAANRAALRFGVDVVGVGWILERPKSIAAINVLPLRVGNAARVGGIAYPCAVVLQTAVDVIRILIIDAHMVELRDWQIQLMLPARASIFAAPQAAIVAGVDDVRIRWINPNVVKIAVGVGHKGEALAAVDT